MRRPSIGVVLLAMNFAALLLPVGGFWVLRIYESALIRQTESELLAQGAVIAASYRAAWQAAGGKIEDEGQAVAPEWTASPNYDAPFLPRIAKLDLATDAIQPPQPAPLPAAAAPSAAALQAGQALTPILHDAQHSTLAGVRVTDEHGTIVATSGEAAGLSLQHIDEVQRALAGEPVSVIRERGNGPPHRHAWLFKGSALRIVVALPVLDGDKAIGAVVLARTPRALGETLYGKRWAIAMLALFLVAFTVLMALAGRWLITRPMRRVTDEAKRIADGGHGRIAPQRGVMVREAADLADALARMAGVLTSRADYIRSFAAHVSHEFKTPLATMRGTSELLRDHFDTMRPEERERFLANIQAEADRLSRLVGRLVDLARADVMQLSGSQRCDLARLLDRLVQHYAHKGLAIKTDVPSDARVAMGEEALEMVLINLLDNVLRHGGSMPQATISLRHARGHDILVVSDNGPGISPANRSKVFEPFFTTARLSGGTGLGLSIVRSLVGLHHGSIAIVADEASAFEIRLPAASMQQ
ncbi:sensor histidine kinase [Methylovirgula sp. 4M-Z18]|uniref:sensor histidine kinase n=1 Tax=Methylovirgula sp. 4M-Z18 TaxID=2293567 RepID=UPI0018F69FA1|nr:HAMP domain-containing sensor histidine kinase [Methylovirgula sp. 4M-Z18]